MKTRRSQLIPAKIRGKDEDEDQRRLSTQSTHSSVYLQRRGEIECKGEETRMKMAKLTKTKMMKDEDEDEAC